MVQGNSMFTISNSILRGHYAPLVFSRGVRSIYVFSLAFLSVVNSIQGGAIFVKNSATVHLLDSVLERNIANVGAIKISVL